MPHAGDDGGQTQEQGNQNPDQNQLVAPGAVDADAVDFKAAVDQDNQTDQGGGAEDAAHGHGKYLLGAVSYADGVPKPQRCKQTEQMAAEYRQHADVKQHAAQPQLAAVEQFAGIAFPGVLLAVETHQAAEEKYGQADIGINAEEKLVEGIEFVHGNSFSGCLMRGGRWGRTVWFGCRWRV